MAHSTTHTPLLSRVGLEYGVKLYRDRKTQLWKEIAPREETTTQNYIQIFQESGFGMATDVDELRGIPFDDLSTPYNMIVTPIKRGISFAISTEAMESEQGYGVLKNIPNKLGLAFNATKEQAAANLFNFADAAATNGPDGVPWASNSHPLESGDTADNLFTNALSATAVETLVEELLMQDNHRGDPFPQMGPYLLMVHPAQKFLARRIVESAQQALEANNDKNVVGDEIKIHCNPYFTDPLAWGLKVIEAGEQGAVYLSRRAFRVKEDEDIHRDAKTFAATEMYQFYQDNWRGFVYSDGTA